MSTALTVAQWSTTAATNATADTGLPAMSDTMDPIGLDNVPRGMMAALAKWRLDIGGALSAGGSANALTVATNGLLEAAHMADGLMLVVRATADNTNATVTFNPDTRGAANIKRADGSALAVGSIKNGMYLILVYNQSAAEWRAANIPPAMVTTDVANTFTAAQAITLAAAGDALALESTDAGASQGPNLSLYRNSASPATSDQLGGINWFGKDSGGTKTQYGGIGLTLTDPVDGSEDSIMYFSVMTGGSYVSELALLGTALYPIANDGLALGLATLSFSDLFLASAAQINFNNSNYTITHSSGDLLFSGTLSLGNADTTLARSAAGVVTVEGNTLCRIKTGTYTGDGATSKAITGVGFTPKYVRIWRRVTSNGTASIIYETTAEIMDDNGDGGAIGHVAGTGAPFFFTNAIIALGSDGFTVDDGASDSPPNESGVVYNYLCLG